MAPLIRLGPCSLGMLSASTSGVSGLRTSEGRGGGSGGGRPAARLRRPALGHLLMIYTPPEGRSLGQPGSERWRYRHHRWPPSSSAAAIGLVLSNIIGNDARITEQPPGVGGGIREADVRYFYSLVTRGAILLLLHCFLGGIDDYRLLEMTRPCSTGPPRRTRTPNAIDAVGCTHS